MRIVVMTAVVASFGALASPVGAAVRSIAAPAEAGPTSSRVATASSPTTVTVRGTGRAAARRYRVPAGCFPAAVSSDAIALGGCSQRVLILGSGKVVPLTIPTAEGGSFSPQAIGRHWMLGEVNEPTSDGLRSVPSNALLNWRTGKLIVLDSRDPYGAAKYADLDVAHPGRRLCSPVRRQRATGLTESKYATLTKVGDWVLQTSASGSRLQKCGSRKVRRWGSGTTVVLGRTNVASFSITHPTKVTVRNLKTGRSKSLATHAEGPGVSVAFSRSALVLSVLQPPSVTWHVTTFLRFRH